MNIKPIFLFCAMLLALSVQTLAAISDTTAVGGCQMLPVEVRHLPDLTIARSGHYTFYVDGELMVAGGHTNGFVPTATAEFLHNGSWQVKNMVYPHDQAFALQLSNGQVLLGGGHEKNLGIGQLFSVERYNPETQAFEGFGCFDTKRVWAQGIELDSGRVVISGNWYHDDAIELFDGTKLFSHLKKVSVERTRPYIFRTAPDDAIILGSVGIRGDSLEDASIVDRVKGDSFSVPLLRQWRPVYQFISFNCADAFIGDEASGQYVYLMPVERWGGELAVARVEGIDIQLLPTCCPLPTEGPWGPIGYFSAIIADRRAGRAYIVGRDAVSRHYALAIDYRQTPAPLTLYYTQPLPNLGSTTPVLSPEGHLVLTGGFTNDNYAPNAGACMLLVGQQEPVAANTGSRVWLWIVLALLTAGVPLLIFTRRSPQQPTQFEDINEKSSGNNYTTLQQRLNEIMATQQPYLIPGLKLQDLAKALGISRRELSECIAATQGCAFASYINRYRIEHAKHLLLTRPNMKIGSVGIESGFANETSFFRTFRSLTNMTPKEWIQQNN